MLILIRSLLIRDSPSDPQDPFISPVISPYVGKSNPPLSAYSGA